MAAQIDGAPFLDVTKTSSNFHGPFIPGVPNSTLVVGSYCQNILPVDEKQKSCSDVDR
jgi:hypothetical protein